MFCRMVKHYINSLDLYNLFKKYVPASTNCLAEHAESLCIITANIICNNKAASIKFKSGWQNMQTGSQMNL